MTRKSSKEVALLAIFSLPFFWGPTFAIVQRALAGITPITFVAVRFWIAGLVFLLFSSDARRGVKVFLRPNGIVERQFRQDMIILGAAIGAGYVFQTVGLLTTTSSKSAFLTSTTIVWTPLLSLTMGRERLTRQTGIAVLVTLLGIYFLTEPFSHTGLVIGDVLTIGCAISFSVYIAWIDRAMPHAKKFASSENAATMMVTSTQILAAAFLFTISIPMFESPHFAITPFSIGALIYTSVIATSLTAYLQTRYQHHVTPTAASIIYMLEPVVAVVIAVLFLREQMGLHELLGGLLIILGVIIAQVKSQRIRTRSATI